MAESELHALGFRVTPRLAAEAGPPPDVAGALAWLTATTPPFSAARLHPEITGRPEGIVVRTPDRRLIAKLRFEDYEKSMVTLTASNLR